MRELTVPQDATAVNFIPYKYAPCSLEPSRFSVASHSCFSYADLTPPVLGRATCFSTYYFSLNASFVVSVEHLNDVIGAKE